MPLRMAHFGMYPFNLLCVPKWSMVILNKHFHQKKFV